MTTKPKTTDTESGVALGLAFFAAVAFTRLTPGYFSNYTTVVGIIFLVLGVFFFGAALNALNGAERKFGLDDFALGLGIIGIWALIYNLWPRVWVNAVIFPIGFIGLFGTMLGLIRIATILTSHNTIRAFLVRLAVAIPIILGSILTLVNILKAIGAL
ncbi:MAG: hypothetical protein ABI604_00880 [Nitrospirota bacterium]